MTKKHKNARFYFQNCPNKEKINFYELNKAICFMFLAKYRKHALCN